MKLTVDASIVVKLEKPTPMASAADKLAIAQHHLGRVQEAWGHPTNWDDLCLYGFYALEAAVDCACLHFGASIDRKHWTRVTAAQELSRHGLEDVSDLLRDLNEGRKSVAYGDVELPELDAEAVAVRIEEYVDSISKLVQQGETR